MFARHSLVWLSEQGWRQACDGAPGDCRDAIAQWRREGWPAVARRRDGDAGDDQACVGIALPPDLESGCKKRIALRVSASHIKRLTPPLLLEEALGALPSTWRGELAAFDRAALAAGLCFHVYGSAAFQAITGRKYMTPASDIDLLFYPASGEQLSIGLGLLAEYAGRLPLDGEIVFPSGQAVAWKEWEHARHARSNPRVLSKDAHTVRLARMDELLGNLEGRHA
jgi:phosphoribosyl-dephospho-CoA transferase